MKVPFFYIMLAPLLFSKLQNQDLRKAFVAWWIRVYVVVEFKFNPNDPEGEKEAVKHVDQVLDYLHMVDTRT